MDNARTIPNHSTIGGILQTRDDMSFEGFSEAARSHGGHCLCDTTSILAQSPCSTPRLAPGTTLCQDRPKLCQSCGFLNNPPPVSNRCVTGSDLQKEGGYKRCLQLGLGRLVGGQSGVRLLVSPRAMPAYQLPRNACGFPSPENLPASLERAPCLCPVGQHDSGGFHQSPRQAQIALP